MKHIKLNRFGIIAFIFSLLVTTHAFAAVDMLLEIEGMSAEGKYQGKVDPVTGNVVITNIPAGHYKMRLIVSKDAMASRMTMSPSGVSTPPSAIEISSFSFGVSNSTIGSQSSGAGSGKVQMSDISIMKPNPKPSSISKVQISGSGEELPKESVAATLPSGSYSNKSFPLTVRKAGKDQQEYYVITLQDVIISGAAPSGTGSSAGAKSGYDLKANVKM